MPILQSRARGLQWIVEASDHGCWLGSYEYEKRVRFEQAVKPGHTVYDIGANVGFYTLLASRLTWPGGRVIAFEPWGPNLAFLRRHVEMNRLANVTVMSAAVGERPGTLRFAPGIAGSLGHLSASGTIEVPVVGIDAFVAAGTAPPPDVIKMDIEGGEVDALRGAANVLATAKPVLFLATHSDVLHHACVQIVRGAGYDIESLSGGADRAGELIATPPR
jgi:FkbM family methyltransferase